MPLTSVGEIKNILMLSSSDYDTTISTLLPIVTNHIENYCNTDFHTSIIGVDSYGNIGYSSSLDVVYPHGLKLAAATIIEHFIYKQKTGNISSEAIGAYSVTYIHQLPDEINQILKPYRRIKFG